MPRSWQWTEEEQAQAEKAHAEFFAERARAAKEMYKQGNESFFKGLVLFDDNLTNIRAGQVWSAAYAEQDEEAAWLCTEYPDAAGYLMDLRLGAREQIRWLEQAVSAAQKLGDKKVEGSRIGAMAIVYRNSGQTTKAIEFFEQALNIADEMQDEQNKAAHLGNLGLAFADLGEFQKAIEYYLQAMAIDRKLGDRLGEGADLGSLGLAYYELDEPQKALEHHVQALEIAREMGDKRNEGAYLGNLGLAYVELGEIRKAIKSYEQALFIQREIGDLVT